jgi:hypothetical protein
MAVAAGATQFPTYTIQVNNVRSMIPQTSPILKALLDDADLGLLQASKPLPKWYGVCCQRCREWAEHFRELCQQRQGCIEFVERYRRTSWEQ